jgi:hypothetical protein
VRTAEIHQRQRDILQRSLARKQVELLEHKTDLAVAHRRQQIAVELVDGQAVENICVSFSALRAEKLTTLKRGTALPKATGADRVSHFIHCA